MRQKLRLFGFISILAFLLSRWFVLTHPPLYYSDVKHDSERYANMWRYGLTPYKRHLYEYPPAAVPIVYLPLVFDQAGIGKYYQNYRMEIFIFESILFVGILWMLVKLPIKWLQKYLAVGFYAGAGMLAKDFWYEGLDLIFMGTFCLGLISWLLLKTGFFRQVVLWAFFWLSTAIKLMTLPLLWPLWLMRTLKFKRELMALVVGFLLIWGLPIAIFRSSLSVFLWFHWQRPLKYGAFGTWIINFVNDFTRSEHGSGLPPDFEMIGSVSTIVLQIFKVLFLLGILLFIIYCLRMVLREGRRRTDLQFFKTIIELSLIYIFVVFLTGKTFSSPFHIWYVPLITLYPFKSVKKQLLFMVLALYMLLLDTTPYFNLPNTPALGPIPWSRFRDLTRFLPMIVLLIQSVKLSFRKGRIKTRLVDRIRAIILA